MNFTSHFVNFSCQDLVGTSFILDHHLHKEELALHEPPGRQSWIDIREVSEHSASWRWRSSIRAQAILLQGVLDVEELGCKTIVSQLLIMRRLNAHSQARIDVDLWWCVNFVVRLRREQLLLESTLAELHIKHAPFLVDLNDRSAWVVSYNSALSIPIYGILLDQFHVSRIVFGQFNFMADRDVRVDHGIFSTHMLQSVRVVSLIDLVEVELSSSCFRIHILCVIAFKIPKIGRRRPGFRIVFIIILQAD